MFYVIICFTFASYVQGNTHGGSPLRYLAVLALGLNLYIIVQNQPTFSYHIFWSSLISSQLAVHFFGGVDKLLLTRWTYEGCHRKSEIQSRPGKEGYPRGSSPDTKSTQPPTNISQTPPTTLSRTLWGFHSLINYRAIATPHAIPKGLHPIRPRQTGSGWLGASSSPHQIPSKPAFLIYHTIRAILSYLSLDISSLLASLTPVDQPHPWPASQDNLFLSPRIAPLWTPGELAWRYALSVSLWITALLVLNLIFDISAVALVATGLSPVDEWPEMFGAPLSVACTLRGFWGGFWHQLLRAPMSNCAEWVVCDVLKVARRRTVVGRYAVLYVTFVLSGVVHYYQDGCQGLWGESVAVWYFQMQAVGIVVEDAVIAVYRGCAGEDGRKENGGGERQWYHWTHLLGFFWVATWFACWDLQWKGKYMRQQARIEVRAFPSLVDVVQGWYGQHGMGSKEKQL